jgi:hypothetical protein
VQHLVPHGVVPPLQPAETHSLLASQMWVPTSQHVELPQQNWPHGQKPVPHEESRDTTANAHVPSAAVAPQVRLVSVSKRGYVQPPQTRLLLQTSGEREGLAKRAPKQTARHTEQLSPVVQRSPQHVPPFGQPDVAEQQGVSTPALPTRQLLTSQATMGEQTSGGDPCVGVSVGV